MRVVLQRVSRASVSVDREPVGAIGRGLVLLVGFTASDSPSEVEWMAEKIVNLRVFADEEGHLNRGLADVGGDLLVVSQFTLYGDTRKGRRPSFVHAAAPEHAVPLYDAFVNRLRQLAPAGVETGVFGAMMDVELVNDGPVTLVLER